MYLKKIYIEITNVCNFHCSFCFPTQRAKKNMPADEFQVIAEKIKPFTNYVYLHVLGEPLLHTQLGEILKICEKKSLYVNISTNGSLLEKQEGLLLQNSVRQINISLHDAEENIPKEKWSDFINKTLKISKRLSIKTYINFRLWNKTNAESEEFNTLCYNLIMKEFDLSETLNINQNKNTKLADNIYLQNAPRFNWQNENATENKTCYALKDHIAILNNGDVVPCCIDAEANLVLGNIFREDLSAILQSEKAKRIKNGFAQNKAVEDYCKKCGFRINY